MIENRLWTCDILNYILILKKVRYFGQLRHYIVASLPCEIVYDILGQRLFLKKEDIS